MQTRQKHQLGIDSTKTVELQSTEFRYASGSDDYAGGTSTTGTVAIGGSTSGNIETAGDTDWFKVTLVSGHTYQFDVKGSPTGNGTLADTFMRVRDSSGNSLAFNDDNGSTLDSRITYTASAGGTYFISAGSASASGTGTYKVSAADVTVINDDYAGSTSTTGTVAIGGSTSGNIETAGDTDWFKVTLVAGHTYQFDVKGAPTGNGTLADTFMRVRDSGGNSLASNDDNGSTLDSRITYTASSSGTYFISAGSASASGIGTYKVTAADVTVINDDYAGDTSTTGTLAIGGSSSGNVETAGDTDWFKVTLVAGHTYQFDVKGSPTGNGTLADTFMRVRDSGGNSLASNDDNGSTLDSRITYTASAGGTYFISAGSASASGTGTYKVSAADVTVINDDYAGNTSTTGTVAIGGSTSGNIETAGDTDWFKVTLVAGHTYQFDVKGAPTGNGTLADTFMRVRDSGGNSLASNDDNGSTLDSRITYTATSGGTYFLSAGSASASGTGTYKVSAADVTVVDDYTNNVNTNGVVTIGGAATSGNIEKLNDTDWFKVTLVAGHTYRFDAKGHDSGNGTLADPFLRLRDGSGTSIKGVDDGGTGFDSSFTYKASSSGTYFLSAGAGNHVTGTGTYKVSATDVTTTADDYSNDVNTTGVVSVGGAATPGKIETLNDTDWFKVTLVAGHTYRFDARGSDSGNGTLADPFLRLRDSTGHSIAFSDDGGTGNDSRFTYTAASSGVYFLSAGAGNHIDGTGTYKVKAADITHTGPLTGQGLVNLAMQHVHPDAPEDYYWVLGLDGRPVIAEYDNPNYAGPWDCAEFVTYCVSQAYGVHLGLVASGREASAGAWRALVPTNIGDDNGVATRSSLAEAKVTAGAIVVSQSGGHVFISEGNGTLVEANVDRAKVNGIWTYYDDAHNPHPEVNGDPPEGVDVGNVWVKDFGAGYNDSSYVALTLDIVSYAHGDSLI